VTGQEWPELPGPDASELEWLRFAQAGVVSWGQVTGEVGGATVRRRVSQRRWQRPQRGTVVTHSGPVSREQQIWAAVLAAGRDAVCAGLTAAHLEGLRGYDRPAIDLLIPAGRRLQPMPGVRVHRTSVLPAGHVRWRGMPPRTVMARSIIDAAAWARSDDDARALIAAAIQQRTVTPDDVAGVLTGMPRSRRRGLVLETVRFAAGGAHSLSEVHLAALCRRFGLPQPDRQVPRIDASGRQRYLDAYWPQWRLHVEVDGSWHLEVRAWWADMRRQNELWIAGERVLRFPAWAIRNDPEQVAAQLQSALIAAGWRP
jgi:Protein of unknown function (DUF559)